MKTFLELPLVFTPLVVALGLACSTLPCRALDWPQWRGPHRDGISEEKGLLKEWPKEGPKLLWKAEDAGSGYSTPAVVGDRVYLLGNEGLDKESVRAISAKDGKQIWSTQLGKVGNPDQKPPFPAARSTPTVDGNALYALGSDGDLACVEASTGKLRWQKSLRLDFKGKPGQWAYSESPLIDGNTLICTPGGAEATLVALNKNTGEVIWKCAQPEGDEAAYASAVVTEAGGVRQYVQLLQKGLVGVDARTGKPLWRYGKAVSRYGANIPSPVVSDGIIYIGSAGTGGGAVKLKAKDGGIEAEELYFESKLPTAIGGSVKVGEFLYGTTAQALLCIEFATGKVKWEQRIPSASSLCLADGRLYLHGENGDVALVEASPEAYRENGRFTPTGGPKRSQPMEKSWAFPVISGGRLLIREHSSLWCYTIQ
ncbi:MAG: PQQ-binding-like beta-propeller repeat protein [Verrucomicrobia bacterium]|nr:PQQ-binding-like beta-propeller repeat protein [Verrucomicrobiota bacterium]MBI3869913.1 PQQ-binding-like beta-propeller repeat protein [Verrucomicrobiota bacterium]